MTTLRQLDALAVSCYDAALGHVTWASVLGKIMSTLGATQATLLQQPLSQPNARVIAQNGFESSMIVAYELYYKDHNVLLKELSKPSKIHFWREGVVRTNKMFCPDELLMASEFYNGFLRAISVRHLLSTTLSERLGIQLTVFQEKAATRHHLRAMRYLAPHLQRSLQVYERLEEARACQTALTDFLEGLARGAAVLDASGRVMYANAALRGILAARDGVRSTPEGLSAADARAAKRLKGAVVNAATGGTGGRFAIARPSGAAPYHVLVSPLGSAGALNANQRGVLVIISDPACQASFDRTVLKEIYLLTPTECEVACQIANGNSPEAAADVMQISIQTVRTHLKRVLQKTQTHRQTDLVRLLLLGRTLP